MGLLYEPLCNIICHSGHIIKTHSPSGLLQLRAPDITKANQIEEQKEQLAFLDFFDSDFNHLWSGFTNINGFGSIKLSESHKQRENAKPIIKKQKNIKGNQESVDKKEILDYAILSNLAYAKYERINPNGGTELVNLKIKDAGLDILSIDLTKFTENPDGTISSIKGVELNQDEEKIMAYYNELGNIEPKSLVGDFKNENTSDIITLYSRRKVKSGT